MAVHNDHSTPRCPGTDIASDEPKPDDKIW